MSRAASRLPVSQAATGSTSSVRLSCTDLPEVDRPRLPVERVACAAATKVPADEEAAATTRSRRRRAPQRGPLAEPGAVLVDLAVDGPAPGEVEGQPGGEETAEGADQRRGRPGSECWRGPARPVRGSPPPRRSRPPARPRRRWRSATPCAARASAAGAGGSHRGSAAWPARGAAPRRARCRRTRRGSRRGAHRARRGRRRAAWPCAASPAATVRCWRCCPAGSPAPPRPPSPPAAIARVSPTAVAGSASSSSRSKVMSTSRIGGLLSRPSAGGDRTLVGGEHRVGERAGETTTEFAAVDEGLQVAAAAAGEQRPGPGEVRDPGDREVEAGAVRQGHGHLVADRPPRGRRRPRRSARRRRRRARRRRRRSWRHGARSRRRTRRSCRPGRGRPRLWSGCRSPGRRWTAGWRGPRPAGPGDPCRPAPPGRRVEAGWRRWARPTRGWSTSWRCRTRRVRTAASASTLVADPVRGARRQGAEVVAGLARARRPAGCRRSRRSAGRPARPTRDEGQARPGHGPDRDLVGAGASPGLCTVEDRPEPARPASRPRRATEPAGSGRGVLAARSVTMRCMSSGSGSTARCVIEAESPSTKNSTPQKSPTPRLTPTMVDSVRRGLRHRSATTYLASTCSHLRAGPGARSSTTRSACAAIVRVVGDEHRAWRRCSRCTSTSRSMTRQRVVAVERAGRLVGEDHGRPVDHRPGDRDPLPLPAGELVGQAGGRAARARADRAAAPTCSAPVARPSARPRDGQLQPDVLLHRQVGEQVVGLVDHAQPALGGTGPGSSPVSAEIVGVADGDRAARSGWPARRAGRAASTCRIRWAP